MEAPSPRDHCLRCVVACSLLVAATVMQGCQIFGFGAAVAESYKRNSTRTIQAEYTGLEGKQWAVLVSADRVIQADYPDLLPLLTAQITGRLAERAQQQKIGAAGFIPAPSILRFQYENPGWNAIPRGELAKRLGVERLIVVELIEYRLHERGNQYLWDGEATGTLAVMETDGRLPDDPAFEKSIRVKYPDKSGMGPQDLPGQAVATSLVTRFVDRCAWVFYAHEEPWYPTY